MPKLLFTMLTLVLLATAAYATDLESLIAAAQNGDAEAQYELSVLYSQGKDGLERDRDEAEKWRLKAAEAGHAEAQHEIGAGYEYQARTEKKPELYAEAVIWYEKAAAQGNFNAQYHLARMYEQGTQIPQNLPKAFEYYLASAQHNNAEAKRPLVLSISQYTVGKMYYCGIPGKRNFDEAYKWLIKAVQNGSGGAEYFINQYYVDGKIKRNPDDILAAAKKGDGYAQLQMMFIYAFGDEMPEGRDIQQAEKWFLAAEEQCVTNAMQAYWLGFICDIAFSEKRNEDQIYAWYLKAAEQGNLAAQCALANILDSYRNNKYHNPQKAFALYMSAVREGWPAYDEIASMYKRGKGVAKSRAKAFVWQMLANRADMNERLFTQAELYLTGHNPILDRQYIRSLKLLAYMRANDIDITDPTWNAPYQFVCAPFVMKDYTKAQRLLKHLADSPNAIYSGPAQKMLGDLYFDGKGVKPDHDKALAYYAKAAAGGYYEANLKLAEMYRAGLGVEQDYVRAYVLAVGSLPRPQQLF